MTLKEKVQNHIRNLPEMKHLKEFSFGCLVKFKDSGEITTVGFFDPEAGMYRDKNGHLLSKNDVTIIGNPIHLNDYLTVLGDVNTVYEHNGYWSKGVLTVYAGTITNINFSLKTGEPATEKDWERLADILKIK